ERQTLSPAAKMSGGWAEGPREGYPPSTVWMQQAPCRRRSASTGSQVSPPATVRLGVAAREVTTVPWRPNGFHSEASARSGARAISARRRAPTGRAIEAAIRSCIATDRGGSESFYYRTDATR